MAALTGGEGDELAAFIAEHRLVPALDSVHPVENIHDAVRHLESGGHFGKIVVSVGGAQG